MVGVAQLVEHQVVALVVVGSSPITHPIKKQNSGSPKLPELIFIIISVRIGQNVFEDR